jgi:hypothetical protein
MADGDPLAQRATSARSHEQFGKYWPSEPPCRGRPSA